ncbi:MAG TPA: M20/M25/M40 family metallo-hydrolase [Baekduia sp.]|uniref:M42 family metallopeptidase n=1 Tax=Baekduia sp. TaxID=2600305 RepID=UPI002D775EDE|nr:M20/M25/M40 family metallo-hydrolase [Baekduia sp.]HET6505370.1 M20/M25/M40 family metallo-hydrolase [Baekduia sp.]
MTLPDDDRILELVRSYTAVHGSAGHEARVAEHVRARWVGLGVDVGVDGLGNVIGAVGGRGPRTLVAAHMDEIGFVVRKITDAGFLLLDVAEGRRRDSIARRFAVGQRAVVLGREGVVAEGVFAAASGHIISRRQLESPDLYVDDIFVDLGVDSRREAEALGIHVGAAVVWRGETSRLGSKVVAKALDDRMMLVVIDLLLQAIDPARLAVELHVAATVQEENGFHGARGLVASRRFDQAVALDVGLAGDIPTVDPDEIDNGLGRGPVVAHKDQQVVYSRDVAWQLSDAARRAGVGIQHGVFPNYGSDGIAFIDAGIPTGLLCTPARYTHTAIEMAALADIRATVRVLAELCAPGAAPRVA